VAVAAAAAAAAASPLANVNVEGELPPIVSPLQQYLRNDDDDLAKQMEGLGLAGPDVPPATAAAATAGARRQLDLAMIQVDGLQTWWIVFKPLGCERWYYAGTGGSGELLFASEWNVMGQVHRGRGLESGYIANPSLSTKQNKQDANVWEAGWEFAGLFGF
jgi:hypothetical protein